jgi:hypothetical protein
MDTEKRCAVVSGFENDGEFLVVEYTQEDGQRAKTGFKRVLWIRGSKEVNEETKAILARGPEFVRDPGDDRCSGIRDRCQLQ